MYFFLLYRTFSDNWCLCWDWRKNSIFAFHVELLNFLVCNTPLLPCACLNCYIHLVLVETMSATCKWKNKGKHMDKIKSIHVQTVSARMDCYFWNKLCECMVLLCTNTQTWNQNFMLLKALAEAKLLGKFAWQSKNEQLYRNNLQTHWRENYPEMKMHCWYLHLLV